MKKSYVISTVVVGIIVIAAILYVINAPATPRTSVTTQPSPTVTPSVTPQSTTTEQVKKPGEYVSYSDGAIATTSGTKLLFFHAPWCPQCRALEKDIQKVELPENTTVFKVDYDTRQDLRQKYGVTIQTTIVKVDNDGNLIEKYVAYDEPTFESVTRNLLD